MSQTEELLNSLSGSDISTYLANSEEEPHIVIGNDRVIVVPESLKRIAVQYDHNVETVTFDCPRYWDGLDMSTMTVYINYILPNRSMGSYAADNVTVDKTDSNLMHFDWTISRNVTSYKGNISFLVCIKKVDSDGNEENHWNSELNTDLCVSQGLETHEIIESTYADIITQLLTRMDHIIAADSTVLDTSLTEAGLAAEAAATGKAITAVSSRLFSLENKSTDVEVIKSSQSLSSTLKSNKIYYLTGEYSYDAPITIEALQNTTIILDNATVKYSGSADNSHILKFNNCTNVAIVGGIFDGNHLIKRGIVFYNSKNCKVSKAEVKNIGNASSAYSAGIDFMGDCSRSVISDSIVHDVVSGVAATDGYIHSVGIGMSSNLGLYSRSVIIDGAQIYNIKGQSSTINDKTTDGDGIYIIQKPDSNGDTWDSHISIRNCHITNCSKRGIKATARHVNIYNTYVDVDSWGAAVQFQLGNGKIIDSYIHNGSNVSCIALSWDNGKTSIENCKIVGSGNNMGIVLNGRLGSSDSRYTSEPQCVEVIGSSIDNVISVVHPGDNDGASENYNSLRFINNRVGSFSEKAICLYQDNATKAQRINSVKSIVIDGLYFKEALTSTQTPVYLGTSSGFINPANTLKVVDGLIDFRNQFSNIPFTTGCIDFGLTKADFDKVFQKANNTLTFEDGTYTANGDTNGEVTVTVLNNDITITASNVTATRSIYIPIGNLPTDIPYANFDSDYKYDWAASSTLTSGSYSSNATMAFANDKLALISSNTILALNGANKRMTISGLSGTASKLRVQVKAGVTMTASFKVTLVRQEPVFVGDLESRIAKLEYAVSNLTAE